MGDWWKALPCHLNPDWKLDDQSHLLDVQKLKHQIESDLRIAPYFMKVEGLLYQAFLEVPPKPFVGFKQKDQEQALQILEHTEKAVERTMINDVDAKNGYSLVINTFRMWIYHDRKERTKKADIENKLKTLQPLQNEKSCAFIDATRAAALSRLGLERCQEAMQLFDKALRQFPRNSHWMFGKALMQGRLARSKNSPMYANPSLCPDVWEMFTKEKKMLEKVIKVDPSFVWPYAYLGQCIFNLNRKSTESCKVKVAFKLLEYALQKDKRNTDIALISARVYRWVKSYPKAAEILNNLPEDSKTFEVSVQLGITYKAQAQAIKSVRDSTTLDTMQNMEELLKRASDCLDEGLQKNSCHIPAAIKFAETYAFVGDLTKAKKIYLNLFGNGDILPINQFHIRKSANKKDVQKIFDPNEILDNVYGMLNLCVTHFTTLDQNSGQIKFFDTISETACCFLEQLTSLSDKGSIEVKYTAKKYLSEIQFTLKKYSVAKEMIVKLLGSNPPESTRPELLWYLGKCHLGLNELGSLEKVAQDLEQLGSDEEEFSSDELFADLNLAIAKSIIPSGSVILKSLEEYDYIIEKLQKAISLGNIEACCFYLKNVEGLQERLCFDEDNIINTLVDIYTYVERCNKQYSQDTFLHHNHPSVASVSFIMDTFDFLLVHPQHGKDDECPPLISNRYELMTKIRKCRFRFECKLLKFNQSWDESFKEITESILSDARKLLDWLAYNLQKGYLNPLPRKTGFPIFFDWKKAEVKANLTRVYQKELLAVFNNDGEKSTESATQENKVPLEMIDFIKKQQPLLNTENNWLVFLAHFNRKDRHYGNIISNEDVFEIKDGDRVVLRYEKIALVRESTKRVEKIGNHILDFVKRNCDHRTQNEC